MRGHIPGLAHTITNLDYISCAFTQKVLKFILIMLGEMELIHYGHEKSDVACEHVSVTTDADLELALQWHIQRSGLASDYNPLRDGFVHSSNDPVNQVFLNNIVREIRERYQPNDFLLCFWNGHRKIAEALSDLSDLHVVEAGIGYPTTFADYRVFESYAKLHLTRGRQHERFSRVGRSDNGLPHSTPLWFDTVIPNYWDSKNFPKSFSEKLDHLFFIGRIDKVKGLDIAVNVARATGRKLVIAGQGELEYALTRLPDCDYEFLGVVDEKERNKWMSTAYFGLTPSLYIEPFCGTHVEFWFNETGIASTPWGVFSETVVDDFNGYKCTAFDGGGLDDPSFVWAINNADRIDPSDCRVYAEKHFSFEAVRPKYKRFFQRILVHNKAVKEGSDPFFFKPESEFKEVWDEDD